MPLRSHALAVTEKFIRDLDVDRERINVNGGGMAPAVIIEGI